MRNFKERHGVDEPTIANIIYLEINKVFNDSIKYLTPYIPSTGARELREIIHHPEIDKIYQRLKMERSELKMRINKVMKSFVIHRSLKITR